MVLHSFSLSWSFGITVFFAFCWCIGIRTYHKRCAGNDNCIMGSRKKEAVAKLVCFTFVFAMGGLLGPIAGVGISIRAFWLVCRFLV